MLHDVTIVLSVFTVNESYMFPRSVYGSRNTAYFSLLNDYLRQRIQLLPAVVDAQGEVFFGDVRCKYLHTGIIGWGFVGFQRRNSDKNDKGVAGAFS